MNSSAQGVGYFTGQNIAAILKALPETHGTYAEVINQARAYDADISRYALGKWVSTGRRDIGAGDKSTAYARFAPCYDWLRREPRTAGAKRQREYERTLQILERTCECGNEKTWEAAHTMADRCRVCQDIDEQAGQHRRAGLDHRSPRTRTDTGGFDARRLPPTTSPQSRAQGGHCQGVTHSGSLRGHARNGHDYTSLHKTATFPQTGDSRSSKSSSPTTRMDPMRLSTPCSVTPKTSDWTANPILPASPTQRSPSSTTNDGKPSRISHNDCTPSARVDGHSILSSRGPNQTFGLLE